MSGGVILGVDGGNTKTDVVAATNDGEPLAFVRGRGSNAHGPGGTDECVAVIAALVAAAGLDEPADHGAFFLCGADVPADVTALRSALEQQPWLRSATVDNDTFALLHAGADVADAIAVVCGGGLNCVGRSSGGRVSHYPSLGWETGDLGGAEGLGRDALHYAARAEDGRGPETVLVDIVRAHFGAATVSEIGEAIHYGRLPETRLGELAASVVEAAADDTVAATIVERLIDEIALLVGRAVRDLDLDGAFDIVLGGGMLEQNGPFYEQVASRVATRFTQSRIARPRVPPVAGAVLAALDAVGASADAAAHIRAAFAGGYSPEAVHG